MEGTSIGTSVLCVLLVVAVCVISRLNFLETMSSSGEMDKAGEGDEEQKQQQQQQQPQGEESGWVKVIDVKIDQDQPPPVFTAGTTNEQFIRCSFCNSLMVRPQIAHMETIENSLPAIKAEDGSETIGSFWCIKDMFQFENMSFTKTLDEAKYLCCCDCEVGPIGFQCLTTKQCYLAPGRVSYHAN